MSEDRVEGGDALSRWLAGAGLAALDGIVGSALDVSVEPSMRARSPDSLHELALKRLPLEAVCLAYGAWHSAAIAHDGRVRML